MVSSFLNMHAGVSEFRLFADFDSARDWAHAYLARLGP